MKNFLIALVLSMVATVSFAGNSFCDGQRGQRALNTCYRMAIDAQRDEMRANLKAIRSAPKAQANLPSFNENQTNWEVQVNNGCTTQAGCVYDSQVNRNRWLKQQRKLLGV